jgi:hypothetical protein
MADNIGGFKINGTVVAGPMIGLVRRRCPTQWQEPFNRILTQRCPEGPYNNCGVPGAKASFVVANIR